MNEKYWKEFYKVQQPTPFAQFCLGYLKDDDYVADVGCGNMRDSNFFMSKGIRVTGVDFASDCDIQIPVSELIKKPRQFTVIYSRFLLQCLSNEEIVSFLKWTKDRLFLAEFRIKGDKPKIFADHKRNFVDMDWLKKVLKQQGFEILYCKKGRNLAKYKQENPLVGRVIARRING